MVMRVRRRLRLQAGPPPAAAAVLEQHWGLTSVKWWWISIRIMSVEAPPPPTSIGYSWLYVNCNRISDYHLIPEEQQVFRYVLSS
jgi:hypothetical protein